MLEVLQYQIHERIYLASTTSASATASTSTAAAAAPAAATAAAAAAAATPVEAPQKRVVGRGIGVVARGVKDLTGEEGRRRVKINLTG